MNEAPRSAALGRATFATGQDHALSSSRAKALDEKLDIDERIRAAELAVIARDERVREGVRTVKERVRSKGGIGLAIAGSGAVLLGRLLFSRHRGHPVRPGSRGRGSRLLGILGALSAFVPVLAGGRAARGGLPALLLGMVMPAIGEWLARKRATASQAESGAGSANGLGARVQRAVARKAPVLPPVSTAGPVDLARYLGRWYEIARLPNSYEKRCASDVTSDYAVVPGQGARPVIAVTERCRYADGRIHAARGIALLVAGSGNAHLKVSFAPRLVRWLPAFRHDYLMLLVDDAYRYALVGTPDRRRLWLLSRSPSLESGARQRMIDYARGQGYDVEALVDTAHTAASEEAAPPPVQRPSSAETGVPLSTGRAGHVGVSPASSTPTTAANPGSVS
ncbi:lipocalin family protein [Propionivibrio soli]|uniref:lipocalin family protein n=1 Tax=Propionivibrio soli TaxID=2976531 RepID=UPI0021E8F095|nr:lipocalin family protein [Propionivibrio soli]